MNTNKLKAYRLKLKTPRYAGLYLYLVIGEDKKVHANTSRLIKQPPIPGVPASQMLTNEDEIEEAMIYKLKRFCPGLEDDKATDISIGELANLISVEDISNMLFSLNGLAEVEKFNG